MTVEIDKIVPYSGPTFVMDRKIHKVTKLGRIAGTNFFVFGTDVQRNPLRHTMNDLQTVRRTGAGDAFSITLKPFATITQALSPVIDNAEGRVLEVVHGKAGIGATTYPVARITGGEIEALGDGVHISGDLATGLTVEVAGRFDGQDQLWIRAKGATHSDTTFIGTDANGDRYFMSYVDATPR